jgi:hypothetical protein
VLALRQNAVHWNGSPNTRESPVSRTQGSQFSLKAVINGVLHDRVSTGVVGVIGAVDEVADFRETVGIHRL